jgi:hypothetical protein
MLHRVRVIWAKALLIVLPCLKLGRKCYTVYLLCSEKFGFRDTHHRWIAKGILLSKHERPVVTSTSEEDDRQKTDVRSASSCLNAFAQEVLLESSIGVVPILELLHFFLSTAAIMAFLSTAGDRPAFTKAVGITRPPSWRRNFNA